MPFDRSRVSQEIFWNVCDIRQQASRWVVVLRRIRPHQRFAQAVTLSVRAGELKRRMNDVRFLFHFLIHPRHEVRMTARERADWQDTYLKLTSIASEHVILILLIESCAKAEQVVEGILIPNLIILLQLFHPLFCEFFGAVAQEHNSDIGG